MEAVTQPSSQTGQELHLLTDWGAESDRSRLREAGLLSILVHILAIIALLALPKEILAPPKQSAQLRVLTPLIEPPPELTQTAPNKGKVSKEFNVPTILPRAGIQIPPSPPPMPRPTTPKPFSPAPQSIPVPALPPPPKIETATKGGPGIIEEPRVTQPAPPPQIQTEEKPKLAFEPPPAAPSGPARGTGKIEIPNTSVTEAIRSVLRNGSSGRLTVGDVGIGDGGIGAGMDLPPSPGRPGSSLELLSDPKGVDFRPYLIAILASVRRNWFAVMPESAKLGRRGRVEIQFAIDRDGSVPKLVIVLPSGADALDRAAVAGISASNPFPPLPSQFKGDQIRLQFNFVYNMR